MNELVSIITPAYNSANFIAETIQSVQNQTYQNWEMLIVDDGSSDGTEEIVLSFMEKDQRVQFYKLEHNSGPAVARNTAIEKANGDYMTFIDADDIWFPKFIENSIKTIQETETDIINRVKYDIFYLENWSLLLDIKIVLATVVNAVRGEEKAY